MESKVVAVKCPKCNGSGRVRDGKGLFKKWIVCDNCRGVGYIGKDEMYEYYLERGTDGKYRVAEMKKERFLAEEVLHEEKIRFLKTFFVSTITLAYIGFSIYYLVTESLDIIFIGVTLSFVTLIFLVVSKRSSLISVLRKIASSLFSEPKDYKWALHKREKAEKNKDWI